MDPGTCPWMDQCRFGLVFGWSFVWMANCCPVSGQQREGQCSDRPPRHVVAGRGSCPLDECNRYWTWLWEQYIKMV